MLKLFRVFIAVIVFAGLSALFLDFTETIPLAAHVLAHLQLVPLFQAKLFFGLLLWFIVTMLFGRCYCSMICPFGILQDIVSRIAKLLRRKKADYQFRSAMHKTRWAFLLLLIAGLAAVPMIVSLLDPYSNYGRLMTFLARPLYLTGNNYLAGWKPDWFSVTSFSLVPPSAILFALGVMFLVGVLSFFFGRRYCNTICPVGTLLGLFAKIAPFRIRLNENCGSCRLCEKVCKGECIDSKTKTVDVSRCVACFNCLSVCRKKGIAFTRQPETKRSFVLCGLFVSFVPLWLRNFTTKGTKDTKETQGTWSSRCENASLSTPPRRTFLQGLTATLLFGSAARTATLPNGLPTGQSRVSYKQKHPVLPPGAKSKGHLIHHCTACQLCAAKCPANVIRPSITELGLQGFLVPVMKFDHGFCNYHCVVCAQVCPTSALLPIRSVEEKHALQIGTVIFLEENCVVLTQSTNCGACAEHCPTGAVTMRPHGAPDSGLAIPHIDVDLCVGCGACESICPVVPYKAIYVEGLEKHSEAKPAYDPTEKQQEVQLESFGF
jgi:ferredoxin-type protein NapF